MKIKSNKRGTNTLDVEVSHISALGIWMLIHQKEYYMPFSEYPWFRNAKPTQIENVKMINPNHLFWEELDVDLTMDMIINPQNYPLRYQ